MVVKNCIVEGYKVTSRGELINKHGRVLKGSFDKDGYIKFTLKNQEEYKAHRLMLMSFKPVEDMHLLDVNHIDGNKANNSLDNLEWCTKSENQKHAIKNKLRTKSGKGKIITNDELKVARKLRDDGCTYKYIADVLNKSTSAIHKKLTGKRYK